MLFGWKVTAGLLDWKVRYIRRSAAGYSSSTATVATVIERTYFIVAKSDGRESNQGKIDTHSKRPVFQILECACWDEGEEYEEDGAADQHPDDVLAK